MIPMIWTHFFCFLPTLTLFPLYIHIFNPTLAPHDYIIFTSTCNCIPFYAAILPIVLLWRHETLRKSLKSAIRKDNRVTPTVAFRLEGQTEEQILHFEALRIMWTPKEYEKEIRSSRGRNVVENNVQSISASFTSKDR